MDHGRYIEIAVFVQERDDGGLRVWSDDVPGLVLSHRDRQRVIEDIPVALSTILGQTLDMTVTLVGVSGEKGESAPRLKKMQVAARAA